MADNSLCVTETKVAESIAAGKGVLIAKYDDSTAVEDRSADTTHHLVTKPTGHDSLDDKHHKDKTPSVLEFQPAGAYGDSLGTISQEHHAGSVDDREPADKSRESVSLNKQQKRARARKAKLARDKEKKDAKLATRIAEHDQEVARKRNAEMLSADIVRGSCRLLIDAHTKFEETAPSEWKEVRSMSLSAAN